MLQVDISLNDKRTFYIRVNMERYAFSKQINKCLRYDVSSNGFINIVDEDEDIYMFKASEITNILIHELS